MLRAFAIWSALGAGGDHGTTTVLARLVDELTQAKPVMTAAERATSSAAADPQTMARLGPAARGGGSIGGTTEGRAVPVPR
ncbi:hypothetical protein MKSMC1_60680 [Mycobacterium kansasii]|nr:hypothetical protein MKSMC1_60680 [Mycobacterium kansasii]